VDFREHTEERLNKEWGELYERMKVLLQQYGKDDMDGGDYFLVDENFGRYTHQVEMHQWHMLRPEIIKSLQGLLVGYSDWEIEISVRIPEEDFWIDPGDGLTLSEDEIVDSLDRELLPKEYRDVKYEGSRLPKGPGDIAIFRDKKT
jgi:hypothetical protein